MRRGEVRTHNVYFYQTQQSAAAAAEAEANEEKNRIVEVENNANS